MIDTLVAELLHEHLLTTYTTNGDDNNGNEQSANSQQKPDGNFASGLS